MKDQRPQPAPRQGWSSSAPAKRIANVELDVNGLRHVAWTTVEAVRELGLQEGADVTALVKGRT